MKPSIDAKTHHPDFPEIKVISNVGETRNRSAAPPLFWHQDAFNIDVPAEFTLMRAVEVPQERGQTLFVSTRVAYETLDKETRAKIENLSISYKSIFKNKPPHAHPMVRIDSVTHQKELYINNERVVGIEGMDYNEAMELINHVFYHAITCHEPYEHQYTKGDILVWDNFSLLHAATHKLPTTEPRILQRVYISA